MNKRIVFRNMEHSDIMENHANEQLHKVEDFLSHEPDPIYIDLFLEPSHVHAHHRVELNVKSPHYERTIHKEGPQFYQVLDHVIDVMYRALLDDKERRIDSLKQMGRHDEFKKQR